LNRAIQDYDKAIKLNPKYADAYNNRGVAYSDKGQVNRATHDLNMAIELNPKSAATYYNRGIAYRKKGELNRAIQDLYGAARLSAYWAKRFQKSLKNHGFYNGEIDGKFGTEIRAALKACLKTRKCNLYKPHRIG
tara:strand:- start:16423 stop:16827 length:405 start_codon:yes stop_codon:yes gene_type:complete